MEMVKVVQFFVQMEKISEMPSKRLDASKISEQIKQFLQYLVTMWTVSVTLGQIRNISKALLIMIKILKFLVEIRKLS